MWFAFKRENGNIEHAWASQIQYSTKTKDLKVYEFRNTTIKVYVNMFAPPSGGDWLLTFK